MLSPIDKLLAVEEIKKLKARYFRVIDSHDWVAFRGILADDAVFGSPNDAEAEKKWKGTIPWSHWTTPHITGADAIVAWISAGLANGTSVHRGFNAEIEVLTADTARGIWGLEDILRFPGMEVHGYGHYRDTYVRSDGVWRIKSFEVLRKSVEFRYLQTTGDAVV
ncbi:MAG: nuclear transport factor 2 family protein [Rhodospirillaceae bacterium]|nr:MAG: nuclear transport factor 2 family protein [Rhodospirillaceae bacterium]